MLSVYPAAKINVNQCRARQFLSAEQFLLTTLVVKLAVDGRAGDDAGALPAVPAHPDLRAPRLARPADLRRSASASRSTAGVVARLLLGYNAADLTLEGVVPGRPDRRPLRRRHRRRAGRPPAARHRRVHRAALRRRLRLRRRRPARAVPEGSDLALLAVRLHRACHRRAWQMLRTLQVDWQVVLLLAPVGARAARARRSASRWSEHHRLFYLAARPARGRCAVVLLATVLSVATPIKIWNNARIEHRLQEQEKLLLAARIEALANQINPHFLFNTLTSISSLIRTQPETARMLITKLSGLLRRLMRSTDHFVTLREELESIDEYLDIEVIRFGPQLRVDKQISPDTLDIIVPSMILQPLVENSIKHGLARKVGGGRITITDAACATATRSSRCTTTASGMTEERLEHALGGGIGLSNVNERLRTIYGAALPAEADERARPGHVRHASRFPS